MKVPFFVPWITDKDKTFILKSLDSRWLTNGPFLNKFERARLIGVRIQQLSSGAQPKICTKGFNSIKDIVEEELIQRKIPLIIKRILPNGESEEWRLEEFEKV